MTLLTCTSPASAAGDYYSYLYANQSFPDSVRVTVPSDAEDGAYYFWIVGESMTTNGVFWYPFQYDSVRFRVDVSTSGQSHPRVHFMSMTDSTIWVAPTDPPNPDYPYGLSYATIQLSNVDKTVEKAFLLSATCTASAYCSASSSGAIAAGATGTGSMAVYSDYACCNGTALVIGRRGYYSLAYPYSYITESTDTMPVQVHFGVQYKARINPRSVTRSRTTFESAVDTMYVRNATNAPNALTGTATYDLTTNCGRFAGCTASPSSATLFPGDSVRVLVRYATDSIVSSPNPVRLIATPRYLSMELTALSTDSAAVQVSVIDNNAPTITVAGVANAGTVTARSLPVTISICDSDGTLRAVSVALNGTVLGPPVTATTIAGCHSARRASHFLWLRAGQDTLIVSASDGVHTTTDTRIFTYDPAYELRPRVTAMVASGTVLINAAGVDTFVVRNPGPFAATYQLAVSCTGFTAGCSTAGASVAVAAGSSEKVTISYPYTGSNPTGATVTLKASYVGAFTLLADSATSVLNAMAGTGPTVAITPTTGTTVTTSATAVTVTWCSTSALATHDVYLDSLKLADTFQATTVSGCAVAGTSTWSSVALKPWTQVISAVAVDAQGRRTSVGNTITYNAPLSAVRPIVSPKNTTASYMRSVTASQLFTINNPTAISATYALSASCGSYASCALYRSSVILAPMASDTARVYFTTSSTPETTAAIKLIAQYTTPSSAMVADTGLVTASTPTYASLYQSQVTPVDGNAVYWRSIYSTIDFWVKNIGTDTATYTIPTPVLTGGFGVPYSPLPSSVVVAPGETRSLGMGIASPNVDGAAGEVVVTTGVTVGAGLAASSTGKIKVTVREPTYGLRVSPKTLTYRYTPGRSSELGFTVTNTGNYNGTFYYTPICGGFVMCTTSPASVSVDAGSSVMVLVYFTTAASYHAGDNTMMRFVVNAGSNTAPTASDTGSIDIPPLGVVLHSVAVAPDSTALRAAKAVTARYNFTITNRGDDTTTVQYDLSCTGALVSCRLNDTTSSPTHGVTTRLSPGESATLGAWYTTVDAYGSTGVLTLFARHSADTAAKGTGKLSVLTALIDPVTVVASSLNPGTSINRASCLTVAVSEAAAYECGDLRVVHPLPAIATMGKARAPTLVYSSAAGAHRTLLAVNVTLNPGTEASALQAVLKLRNNTPTDSTVRLTDTTTYGWDNLNWPPNATRRISVPIRADAADLETGSYRYTLEIGARDGSTTRTGTETGTIVIINRTNSPFGSGWWLDGLEQLIPVDSYRKLWVGGDGSTRMFHRATLTDTLYSVTPMLERPEYLIAADSGHRRLLPNGAYVAFDNTNRHVRTISALKDTTRFHWSASALLDSIVLPVPAGGPRRAFTFNYVADTIGRPRVSEIRAGNGTSNDRLTTITTTRYGVVTSIRLLSGADPLSSQVQFEYLPSVTAQPGAVYRRMSARTDRLLHTTSFLYDAGGALQRSQIATSGTPVTHTFCAAETRSLTSCSGAPELLANVTTTWKGPRTDTGADVSQFFVNQYGAPDTVVNALGDRTRIERQDALFPLLPTKIVQANDFTTMADYNPRGLVARTIERNPFGMGDATTTYRYHPKWDLADSIASPAPGEFVLRKYHSTWPVDTAQVDARGDSSASAVYLTSTGRVHLLRAPGQPADTGTHIGYDALGNISETRTRLGVTETHYRDVNGLDSVTTVTLNATGAVATTYVARDALGRDRRTITFGPRAALDVSGHPVYSTAASDTVIVEKWFNRNDALDSLTRWVAPNSNALRPMTTRWTYDNAGRTLTEKAADGATESYNYGDGVNLTTLTTRRADMVTMRYDVLNRLVARVTPSVSVSASTLGSLSVPAQVDSFAYDVMGRMIAAINPFAQVTREYYKAGALKAETQRLATAAGTFGAHDYVLQYEYDPAGRRTHVTYPSQLAIGSSTDGAGSVDYRYDIAGQLKTVTSAGMPSFSYGYDRRGRRVTLTRPNGIFERTSYDDDDRQTALFQRAPAPGLGWYGTASDTIRQDSLQRDLQGHAIGVRSFRTGDVSMAYNAAGPLVEFYRATTGYDIGASERYTVDALGNVKETLAVGLPTGPQTLYDTTGRLKTIARPDLPSIPILRPRYDAAGNQDYVTRAHFTRAFDPSITGAVLAWTNALNAYDAAGRLRFVRQRRDTVLTPELPDEDQHADEETRYDALGRRVWVTSAHVDTAGTCSVFCSVTRFVHDGAQVLGEFRMPMAQRENETTALFDWMYLRDSAGGGGPPIIGADSVRMYTWRWGRVVYTHGPDLDAPLAITRAEGGYDSTLVSPRILYPLPDWRGNLANMSYANGGPGTPHYTPPVEDDQAQLSPYRQHVKTSWSVISWIGSLANGQYGETGLEYRRNRYYDPQQGRFTQEDPIGLAGGMNLYGFAGGDPVNFTDPFGLCPLCPVIVAGQVVAHSATFAGATVAAASLVAAAAVTELAVGVADAVTMGTIGLIEAPRLHGNSLLNTRSTQGYSLRDRDTGEVLKYGETTMGQARYTKKYLNDKNAQMVMEANGSKKEMHDWQHEKILDYKAANDGKRPALNKSDWD